jgi:hypothetical protein
VLLEPILRELAVSREPTELAILCGSKIEQPWDLGNIVEDFLSILLTRRSMSALYASGDVALSAF